MDTENSTDFMWSYKRSVPEVSLIDEASSNNNTSSCLEPSYISQKPLIDVSPRFSSSSHNVQYSPFNSTPQTDVVSVKLDRFMSDLKTLVFQKNEENHQELKTSVDALKLEVADVQKTVNGIRHEVTGSNITLGNEIRHHLGGKWLQDILGEIRTIMSEEIKIQFDKMDMRPVTEKKCVSIGVQTTDSSEDEEEAREICPCRRTCRLTKGRSNGCGKSASPPSHRNGKETDDIPKNSRNVNTKPHEVTPEENRLRLPPRGQLIRNREIQEISEEIESTSDHSPVSACNGPDISKTSKVRQNWHENRIQEEIEYYPGDEQPRAIGYPDRVVKGKQKGYRRDESPELAYYPENGSPGSDLYEDHRPAPRSRVQHLRSDATPPIRTTRFDNMAGFAEESMVANIAIAKHLNQVPPPRPPPIQRKPPQQDVMVAAGQVSFIAYRYGEQDNIRPHDECNRRVNRQPKEQDYYRPNGYQRGTRHEESHQTQRSNRNGDEHNGMQNPRVNRNPINEEYVLHNPRGNRNLMTEEYGLQNQRGNKSPMNDEYNGLQNQRGNRSPMIEEYNGQQNLRGNRKPDEYNGVQNPRGNRIVIGEEYNGQQNRGYRQQDDRYYDDSSSDDGCEIQEGRPCLPHERMLPDLTTLMNQPKLPY